MKKILYLATSALLAASCSGSGNGYTITGKIGGIADSTVVTLSAIDNGQLNTLDSAIVKNEKFSIKGKTDTCYICILTFKVGSRMHTTPVYLEKGNIKVVISPDGTETISGTKVNDSFQNFTNQANALNSKAMELDSKMRVAQAANEDMSPIYTEMADIQKAFLDLLAASIEENADNSFGFEQLLNSYDAFEPERVATFLEKLAPAFSSNQTYQELENMINSQLRTTAGNTFIDFSAPSLKNNKKSTEVKLSDIVSKNKVTLLDFWASWCKPCRDEIPNLKASYEKYKGQGFDIVSISVDEDEEAWINAVKENDLRWTQLLNVEDGTPNSPAALYTVLAIPATYLIDNDGTIIARNLRGQEIDQALEDFFKTK